jgi:hypothetical protein
VWPRRLSSRLKAISGLISPNVPKVEKTMRIYQKLASNV